MEQELHLQPLPTSLSQGQGRWALRVPGVTGHRCPTEEQSLRLCQVTGGDGRTQSLQQSQEGRGEANGSHQGGGGDPSKRSRVSAVSCRPPGRLPDAWSEQRRLKLGEKLWSRQRIPPLRSQSEVIRQQGGPAEPE